MKYLLQLELSNLQPTVTNCRVKPITITLHSLIKLICIEVNWNILVVKKGTCYDLKQYNKSFMKCILKKWKVYDF